MPVSLRTLRSRRTLLLAGLLALALGCNPSEHPSSPEAHSEEEEAGTIHGRVIADGKGVADARVRIKGTTISTRSDADGIFKLDAAPNPQDPPTVTAAKKGFFIQGTVAETLPVVLELQSIPSVDYEAYKWTDPHPDETKDHNCGNCHLEIYEEWKSDAHAHSATNPRFLNLYDGTDWHGTPNVGWNLLEDYPEGAGVCNSCHAPSASLDELAVEDIRNIHGVAKEGVHCDFCHKVQDVSTEAVGLAHGRFGMSLLRPDHGQLFFGPLDDVDRGDDVYSPLQSQSQYCASCHEGVIFGVHVYSTYSEWLESPARQKGLECQSCHMRPTGKMTNIAPNSGGINRDPHTLASHQFLRGDREQMLNDCLQVESDVEFMEEETEAEIRITTRNVGHRVPTGFIDRHLILVVEAFRADGTAVSNSDSELQLPERAGDFSGKAGKLYAKYAPDNGEPRPFWQLEQETIDTRLLPDHVEQQKFQFGSDVDSLRVRLLYRRFWQATADEKQWPENEIVVYDETFSRPTKSTSPQVSSESDPVD